MTFKQWAAWLGAWVLFAWTYGAVCTALDVPPWATVILPAFLGAGIYVSRARRWPCFIWSREGARS
jgi:hypothetical protein